MTERPQILKGHTLLAETATACFSSTSRLVWIDWLIILAFIAISIGVGVVLSRRGRKSVREYFTSGGATPWWLLGTSMVATTFAADTPLTLAGWVVTKGIAQNWFWWCQIPVTMLGVFFIARLWRRTQLVTDTELVDLRYSGRSARALRGFKALYLALVYGCIVIGWVSLAMTKIIQLTLPNIPRVHVVDELLVQTYLNTPLSDELATPARDAMRAGRIDPLRLYYDAWSLHEHPRRVEVIRDIEQIFRRAKVYNDKRAEWKYRHFPPDLVPLRDYLRQVEDAPFLARLGLGDREHEIATLLESPNTANQVLHVPALEVLYNVQLTVAAANKLKIIVLLFIIVMAYTVLSGLWGVMVTDFIQFWIAMAGCILLAVLAVRQLGGMDVMLARMAEVYSAEKARGMVGIIPATGAGDLDLMPWSRFLVFALFAWYVTGLTDGGSYLAQRMLSAKNERHAALGYLWYAAAHYCIRMWPWIIVGFAAAVMFPYTKDAIVGEYPGGAVAENGYIKVMLTVLPAGLLGVVLASFLAAFMSTISTQLNLGASYLLNDFYRPFIKKTASERHYVVVAQLATVLMAAIGLTASLFFNTISGAWFLLGTLNAGIGLIYLLRWFWWRVSAWTEIACLGAMLTYAILFKTFENSTLAGLLEQPLGDLVPEYPLNLLYLVPFSVGTALLVTFLTRPVDRDKLVAFVRRVQPGGPGWRKIEAIIRESEPGFRSNTPLGWANLRRWAAGTMAIYCLLFGIGKLVVGDVFTPDPWLPGRLVGSALIIAGLLLSWVVVRSFSERRWADAG